MHFIGYRNNFVEKSNKMENNEKKKSSRGEKKNVWKENSQLNLPVCLMFVYLSIVNLILFYTGEI